MRSGSILNASIQSGLVDPDAPASAASPDLGSSLVQGPSYKEPVTLVCCYTAIARVRSSRLLHGRTPLPHGAVESMAGLRGAVCFGRMSLICKLGEPRGDRGEPEGRESQGLHRSNGSC